VPAASTVTGSTVESIDSRGLSMTVQTARAEQAVYVGHDL